VTSGVHDLLLSPSVAGIRDSSDCHSEYLRQPPDRGRAAVPAAVAVVHSPERRRRPRSLGPAPVHLETAQWLLALETRNAEDVLGVADAAERACQKFLDRLARLITPSGCQALLSRALYLAQADFQFLAGIDRDLAAAAYLDGLRHRAEGADPRLVHRALAALLGTLIELTALFIGVYVLWRLLLEVWPELPMPDHLQPAGTG